MIPTPMPTSEILGMSDQFWSSVAGALFGALAAGIISAVIARAVFKAERKARETETAVDHKRRDKERQEEARDSVVRLRTSAVSELITLVRDAGNGGGFGSIPPAIQNATQALLLDRTEESYIVYKWVMLKLGYIADYAARGQGNVAPQVAETIIVMLISWIRDEPGVLVNMTREVSSPLV